MTINVYAWPPVHAVARLSTIDHPVQTSRSLLTGAEFTSGFGRARRRAQLTISALSGDRGADGYLSVLKSLVAGVHAVRLSLPGPGWHLDAARLRLVRQGELLQWYEPPAPVSFDENFWTGRAIEVRTATAGGAPVLVASRLPANTIVARPGEQITIYGVDGVTPDATAIVKSVARSDAAGDAVIALMSAVGPYTSVPGRRINIGTDESAVFKVESWPEVPQPVGQNWQFPFSFREVFADEVGGFTEVDPWATYALADLDP